MTSDDPLVRNWDVKFTISTSGIALVVVQTDEVGGRSNPNHDKKIIKEHHHQTTLPSPLH